MNNKGQSILSEYVMVFFVVIAAATAMTVFVQRAFEARVHDARNFAVSAVMNSSVCDANCVQAAGGNISYEYEPYYTVSLASVQQNQQDSTGATTGSAQEIGAKYYKNSNETTQTIGDSAELPPCCDMNPVPGWCDACGANEKL